MPLRYYIDADLLGVAKLLVQVRPDVTYAGDPGGLGPDRRLRPACAITPETPDAVWIPRVASMGWVVISRDRHILHRPAEKQAIVDHAARIITLDARKTQLTKWLELEIVVSQWRAVEQLTTTPGPWVYTASRTGLRKVV